MAEYVCLEGEISRTTEKNSPWVR